MNDIININIDINNWWVDFNRFERLFDVNRVGTTSLIASWDFSLTE